MSATITVVGLRTEHRVNPLGIDVARPRFSWKVQAPEGAWGVMQAGYQIQTADSADSLRAGDCKWDSGKVNSDASVLVAYAGPDLGSGQRVYWRVRVWADVAGEGVASDWGELAWFEMGKLSADDWSAQWVSPVFDRDFLDGLASNADGYVQASPPCPMLRSAFSVEGEVVCARAYVSAMGLYELSLNGDRVGDALLTPGWTTYDHRVQYQVYGVTDAASAGENVIGAMLANGWWRGPLMGGKGQRWGNRLGLLCQLEITYADGSTQVVASDPSWVARTGPIRSATFYHGETYDARQVVPGWDTAAFDASGWEACEVVDGPAGALVAQAGPDVRRIVEVAPVEIITTPEGDTVVDMGQNMVGWVRLKVNGQAGDMVKLQFIEVLDRDGNVYTDNLRRALCTDTYTCAGTGVEVWEPRFTFHGFRYVVVQDWPGELSLDDLTGVVIHSRMDVTGEFACSHPLVNQLQHNILWGQKGNFVDVPTDCPQRDERLGWMGDAQVFIRTAAYNMDVAAFFTKWVADVLADQREDGSVPEVVPDILKRNLKSTISSAAWADALVICPWTVYLCYGDVDILRTAYPNMRRYVDHLYAVSGDEHIWQGGFYGDWLSFQSNASDGQSASTSKDLIGTAFMAYSTRLTARVASVLGMGEEATALQARGDEVAQVWRDEFLTPNGRVASDTQTGYVLALMFNLVEGDVREAVAENLVKDIKKRGTHLTTGFVGTPYLCHVLSRIGHTDVAYDLVARTEYPSWLYPVTQGATTIWERWDGQKPDGTFQTPSMNSFNHYAYGAIGDWLYQRVAGLQLDEAKPGYKHAFIAPEPGGDLNWPTDKDGSTWARGSLETSYGTLTSSWRLGPRGHMALTVTVPPNTTATVKLPGAWAAYVEESGAPVADSPGVSVVEQLDGATAVVVGSGTYTFTYRRGQTPPALGMGEALARKL